MQTEATSGSATTSLCLQRSSMLGSTPTLHRTTVQVCNGININSNPKALQSLAPAPTRSAKSSWMVTRYTYTEATQDFKIFTCRAQQYVHKYDYINNRLRQPAYNYSSYSSTTTSPTSCVRLPRLLALLVVGYFAYAVHRDYSSPGRTGSTSTLSCTVTTRHSAAKALL
jgi:hypothetical protein